MKKILRKAINPLYLFINDSRAVGIMLLINTALSLIITNSVFGELYRSFWNFEFHYGTSAIHLPESFAGWINNFLMAFFFLIAGREIKREILSGELATIKKAMLPFGAALGGMIVPALFFIAFNLNSGFIHGWGIPTATDIAFSIGIASLLGKRVPMGLRILLMALAIIDDLGAIAVIALFYGGSINMAFLGISAILYLGLFACTHFKLKFGPIQILLSLALWFTVLNSGIEGSIVGVLVAFALPVDILAPKAEKALVHSVNFLILPLFALANTSILLTSNIIESLSTPISMGIIFGLVLGKPLGILLFSRILVALKIASLPRNIRWRQVLGMGILAGIGFTMSIFTTTLAFKETIHQDIAKISILLSVVLSLVLSLAYFLSLNLKEEIQETLQEIKSVNTEPDPYHLELYKSA